VNDPVSGTWGINAGDAYVKGPPPDFAFNGGSGLGDGEGTAGECYDCLLRLNQSYPVVAWSPDYVDGTFSITYQGPYGTGIGGIALGGSLVYNSCRIDMREHAWGDYPWVVTFTGKFEGTFLWVQPPAQYLQWRAFSGTLDLPIGVGAARQADLDLDLLKYLDANCTLGVQRSP
jgi:hypothetical protein